MWFILPYLYLATVVLCLEQPRVQNVEQVKQSFHFRRAVDGTRGRKYFNSNEDGSYDSYGSEDGHYDPSQVKSGFANIRSNVPGEPGIDYPAYERVPKTRFSCEGRSQGYYADEEAGCQAFHVCSNLVISSFICPPGSIFSQELLTCDWWSNVDCGMTSVFALRQGIYNNENEMIHKAYTMTQLRDQNDIKSESQIGTGEMKIVNVGYGDNDASFVPGRDSLVASRGRETRYYDAYPSKQPEIHGNFNSVRNQVGLNGNTPPKSNIINVSLRPNDFGVTNQGENPRPNNHDTDSSIFYVKKSANTYSQDSYTTSQPAVFENEFQNSYEQNQKIFRNQFQSSYAPTVPTVTTTTRRLYSPTVPTTYRPSTISYNNYDQYFEGSDHLFTHSRDTNFVTTRSTTDYNPAVADNDRFENPTDSDRRANQEASNDDRPASDQEQYEDDFTETVQAKESIGIGQSYGGRLNKVENLSGEKLNILTRTNLQSKEAKEQDKYQSNSKPDTENMTAESGTRLTSSNSNVSGIQQNYQHFYSNRLSRARKQDEEDTGKVNSVAENNSTQADEMTQTRDEKNLNSINSRLGIPPLIVQIPRPVGSPGRPITDIADQLFTFDAFNKMTSTTFQSDDPVETPKRNFTDVVNRVQDSNSSNRIPPLISETFQTTDSSGTQSSDMIDEQNTSGAPSRTPTLFSVDDREQAAESSTRIPPLISQTSQPATSSGAQFTTATDEETFFGSPPIIPPLIPQSSQSDGSSGVQMNVDDGTQSSESSTRIPPLISQSSQSTASSGTQSTAVIDDDTAFGALPGIPPLISQNSESGGSLGVQTNVNDGTQSFESSTRIPSLIPQSSQSAASSEAQSTTALDDETLFNSPPEIPPLIPQSSQSAASSGTQSTAVINDDTAFGALPGIPPLISQNSQFGGSLGVQTNVNDATQSFESPTRIPPLISQSSQPAASSGAQSTSASDDDTIFDSPPEIPPLIPQSAQSTASSGSQSSTVIADDTTFSLPPRIPQLVSQNSESIGSGGVQTNSNVGTQSLESSTRIPPLISQTSQSPVSSGSQSATVIDDDTIYGSPPRIPPLIPQSSQSFESSQVHSTSFHDETQNFDEPISIPPLIPQSSQSAVSSESQSTTNIDDNATFGLSSRIPPLIPQNSQSVGSSGFQTNSEDRTQSVETSTRIPMLIPQSSQSAVSSGGQSTTVIDDDTPFDIPPRIPPLIPQSTQPAVLSGAQSTTANDDNTKFSSPPRIPPLISQNSQSDGSGGVQTNIDHGTQSLGSSTRIPPLIPQFSQSVSSSGGQSTVTIDDDTAFGASPGIPTLVSQNSQSVASSGFQTNVNVGTQSFGPSTRIPPLIPQTSQSTVSSGAQPTTATDDNATFGSPPRIPQLIPQSGGSWEAQTNVEHGTHSFGSSTRIPPLIPQFPQSVSLSGGQITTAIDDDTSAFDTSSRIPPLISENSQSVGSSGFQTNVNVGTQSFGPFTRIPPLIPQSSRPAVPSRTQSTTGFDDNTTFGSPPRIPPSISQNSQFVGSWGAQTNVNHGPQNFGSSTRIPPLIPQFSQSVSSSGGQITTAIDDDTSAFDTPSRIPPLISENSQSVGSSGFRTNVNVGTQSFGPFTRIPPLIPQSSQFAVPSRTQSTTGFDDNTKFNSPSRIPPLISQNSQSVGSWGAQTNVDHGTQNFGSFTRIPPLIPQFTQSVAMSGAQLPPVVNANKPFGSSPSKPPLISQISQLIGSSEVHPTHVDNGIQRVDSPTKIPSLISQSSQSAVSSGVQLPTAIGESNTFYGPPRMQPSIYHSSQSTGTSGVNVPHHIDQSHTFGSSTEIPHSVSQNDQPLGSSNVKPAHRVDEQHISHTPPRVPPLISQISRPPESSGTYSEDIFQHQQTSYLSDKAPSWISKPVESSATYSKNPFSSSNPLTTTTEATYFTFRGQYEKPLPFTRFQTTTRLPPPQFVTTPSPEILANDFNLQYGSNLETKPTTIRPFGGSGDSANKEFRIHVPDFPSEDIAHSSHGTLGGQSSGTDSIHKETFVVSSQAENTEVQTSDVVPHLPATDYQQSSIPELPNIAPASLPSRNHSSASVTMENNVNQHSRTEIEVPTLTVPASQPDVPHSDYHSVQQDTAPISSTEEPNKSQNTQIPISEHLGPSRWEYNDDLQYTIRGAHLYPTGTPFLHSTAISPTYLPQSIKSTFSDGEQKVQILKNSNTANNPTHLSNPENHQLKGYQESHNPNAFHSVISVGNNFVPTSSQPPLDNFGYSKERFESNRPTNVLDTTSIKSAQNSESSSNGFVQDVGASGLPFDLPSSFGRIEASLNNGRDSPYELHFTVNADEDFDPSLDFISKLLAQNEGSSSLGLNGFGGYEIIKSDSAGGLEDENDVKSTVLPTTVQPSVAPVVERLLFDVRGSFANQTDHPENGSTNNHSNYGTSSLMTGETLATGKTQLNRTTGMEQSNLSTRTKQPFDSSGSFSRGENQDVTLQIGLNSKSDDLSITNPPRLDGNVMREQLPKDLNLSKLRVGADDINRSLESLVQFTPVQNERSPLRKEQILEELTKNFGQPLYGGIGERNFASFEASHNVDHKAAQQFANLQKYRVGKNSVSDQKTEPTNPSPPEPSTTTTPEPIKTIVETEFIPSLGFSFDSDDGRNEYVEAVLKGLLAEHQPVYQWDNEPDFYRESRDNSKSRNDTAKV